MKLQVYKGGNLLKKCNHHPVSCLMYRSTRSLGFFFPEVGTRIWPARGVSLVRWPDARWVSLRFRPCRSSRNKPGGLSETKTRRGILILAIFNNPHIILGSTIPVYQKINQGFEHCSNWFSVSVYWISLPFTTLRYVSLCFCIFLASYKSYHFDSLTENETYFFNYYHHIWDLVKISLKILAMEPIKIRGLKKVKRLNHLQTNLSSCQPTTFRASNWGSFTRHGHLNVGPEVKNCHSSGFCWASTVDTIASIAVKTIPFWLYIIILRMGVSLGVTKLVPS